MCGLTCGWFMPRQVDQRSHSAFHAPRQIEPPDTGESARHFPNVRLLTHEGKSVRFYDDLIRGRIVTLNFMYARCQNICPGMTSNLVMVQRALGKRVGREIFMYSITLKPEEDTPLVLKSYAATHDVKPGWLFLTGQHDDIEMLRRRLGFVDPDPAVDADTSQHIGVVLYGNDALDRWAACPALTAPEEMAKYVLWMEGRSG